MRRLWRQPGPVVVTVPVVTAVTGTVRAVVAVTPTPSLTTRAAVWRRWGKSLTAWRSKRLATMG